MKGKPVPGSGVDPRKLLMDADRVLESEASVFDGRRSSIAAILTRQAIESALDFRLAQLEVSPRITKRAGFVCLELTDGDPDAIRQVHLAWNQLSDACHATSYDLAPSHQAMKRWIKTAARFVADSGYGN